MRPCSWLWMGLTLLLVSAACLGQPSSERTGLITLTAADRPLIDVLRDVTAQTGIEHRLGTDYEDRAITLRVRSLPAATLRAAVAELYNDRWESRKEQGKDVFMLQPSASRRARQKRLLEGYRGLLRDELVAEAARAALEGQPAPPGLTPEDMEEHAVFSKDIKARGAVLSRFSPEQVQHLLDGQSVRIRLADAPAPIAKVLWNFVEQIAMPDTSEGTWTAQDRANAWVQFSSKSYYAGRSDAREGQDPYRGLPLKDLHMAVGNKYGPSSRYNLTVNPREFSKKLALLIEDLTKGDEQNPGERRKNGGEMLEKLVPAPFPKESRLYGRSELYVELGAAMDLQLVADSHIKKTVPYPLVTGVSLETAMDRLTAAEASRWRVAARVICVRSRNWWIDDTAEPPASRRAAWGKALDDRGFLTPAEASEIALLSPEQQDRLCARMPEASTARIAWMRFYAALKPSQRRAAAGPNGVSLWQVPEETRHILVHGGRDDSLLGNQGFEETVLGALASLKITEEPPVRTGAALKQPPALVFRLQPVPDLTGKTRGAGVEMRVRLPHRPNTTPPAAAGGLGGDRK